MRKPAVKTAAARTAAVKKTASRKIASGKTAPKKTAVKKTAPRTASGAAGLKAGPVRRTAVKKAPAGQGPDVQAAAKPAAAAPLERSPLAQRILACLDDAKAENIICLDLQGRTSIADYMVVATGRSTTHVASIADRVMKMCKEAGFGAPRVEGIPHCDWVLVDANDVIVHIFRPDVREFYNLEKMWGGDRPADSSPSHAGRT